MEPELKTTPPTDKQREAMSYTKDIAIYLALTEEPPDNFEIIQGLFDILIHRIPDDELERVIWLFQQICERIE